jgi:serine/threonine-protein kinase
VRFLPSGEWQSYSRQGFFPGGIMRIHLVVKEGPHQGQVFSFQGHDTFFVGRSQRAHFRLPAADEFFSRIHFMVEVNPPHCRLLDMGSKNGTCVNGQRVDTADLKDGDLIKAGTTVLRVTLEGGDSTAADEPEHSTASASPERDPFATRTELQARGKSSPDALGTAAVPAPRPPGATTVGLCPVCFAPLATPALKTQRASAQAASLCPACAEQARNLAQPIAGYQLVRELGRGGMGVVYLALRLADRTVVALKTIIPAVTATKPLVERFLREARVLRDLQHPHIVAFREMGESFGQLYFAMDYVRGMDAAHLLKNHGRPLPVGRAVALVCQLLDALAYAHARRFVHRDIKPANLLVISGSLPRGIHGKDVVQLADFGLARVYQASRLSGLTMQGNLGGTVPFMAPEQVTNFREARPPADQYAAGATLYNLLTDRFIYDLPRQLHQQIAMILQEETVPIRARRPDLPADLAAVIQRSLAREPGARFADVTAFRQTLLPFAGTAGA